MIYDKIITQSVLWSYFLKICWATFLFVFSKDLNFFLIWSLDLHINVAIKVKSHPYWWRYPLSYSTSCWVHTACCFLFPFLILLNLTSHPEMWAAIVEGNPSEVARLFEWCSWELNSHPDSTPWDRGKVMGKFRFHELVVLVHLFV